MKKVFLGACALSLLTVSCKKEENKAVTPTKENLTGNYKLTAATLQGVNVFDNTDENMNFYEACDRDDIYQLNADMSYAVVDAGVVCNPDNNETGGNWSVSGTTVNLDGEEVNITSFDGRTLKVSANASGMTGTATYVKQ